jgi:hypothetical protein
MCFKRAESTITLLTYHFVLNFVHFRLDPLFCDHSCQEVTLRLQSCIPFGPDCQGPGIIAAMFGYFAVGIRLRSRN